jgi:hypothetical protein
MASISYHGQASWLLVQAGGITVVERSADVGGRKKLWGRSARLRPERQSFGVSAGVGIVACLEAMSRSRDDSISSHRRRGRDDEMIETYEGSHEEAPDSSSSSQRPTALEPRSLGRKQINRLCTVTS